MIFKNEGAAAGASLEHVHSQLIATSFIPPRVEAELAAGQKHFEKTGNNAWAEMLDREVADGSRIVATTDRFILHCPFASRLSGQMELSPRVSATGFESTSDNDLKPLAKLLKTALQSLNNVFPDAPSTPTTSTTATSLARPATANGRADIGANADMREVVSCV